MDKKLYLIPLGISDGIAIKTISEIPAIFKRGWETNNPYDLLGGTIGLLAIACLGFINYQAFKSLKKQNKYE